jgi:mono/diheme cytochrome c family protein
MTRPVTALLPAALVAVLVGTPAAADPTAPVAPAPALGAGKLEYNRDIRPILAENCFACHGPDSAARKADLRVDRREDAVAAKAIVPGKPADSELVTRVFAAADDGMMPPAKSHKKLTAAQKATLKRWVEEGAEYQPHWSFITPARPKPPEVKDKGWVRNPVDNFVLAKLEAAGLKPAPEADRRTLARRLAFDLTGLPPEPADVEAFVADKSEHYYEKYVTKLMDSPHWGEHRGRYWLDYARYADTHGIHFDNFREVWAYRDWVIAAFNANQRFDQFTTEQLAGDLLPNPSLDQLVATGFNRCNITTNEGGIIDEEYVVLYARDRTETTSAVWMGLTTGCAVCHDHKYDPVSQKEFYSLSAFFNNTTQAAKDGNIANTPPVVPVPRPEDRKRWDEIQAQAAAAKAKLDARRAAARPAFDRWLKDADPDAAAAAIPADGLAVHLKLDEGKGSKLAVTAGGEEQELTLTDGYGWVPGRGAAKAFAVRPGKPAAVPGVADFDRKDAFTAAAWVNLGRREVGALVAHMDDTQRHRGWDLFQDQDRVSVHISSSWPANAIKVTTKAALPLKAWQHVAFTYDGSGKAAGVRVYVGGEPVAVDVAADTLTGSTKTAVPLTLGQRAKADRLQGAALQDVRVYSRALAAGEAEQLAKAPRAADVLAKPAVDRTKDDVAALLGWWLSAFDGPTKEVAAGLAAARKEEVAIRGRGTVAHVMTERGGEPGAFVLFRGDYDKRRDPVKAETPAAMPKMDPALPRNRLGLARWLLSKDHPLTARVTVNRFWQELFGTGLVRTSGDFGIAGELPSHPELLDWLAVEFREPTVLGCCDDGRGWDVKAFFRMLVTSATYRQAAVATDEKLAKDRDNRLLSRGPRFRMDAEMIRDNALAASGLLVRKVGGPSVKPYQPDGVWEAVAMIGSNTRNYQRDTGENLYRRSMYTFWKRAAPPAAMEVLNAPNRETCAVRRDRTNTPIAALLTLNDVQFVEAARVLAERAMKAAKDDDARIGWVSARLVARPFRPAELAVVRESLAGLRENFRAKPDDAKKLIAFGESKADAALDASELAAWTMLVNQLLNLDEVLNK